MGRLGRLAPFLGDASGAVADLGVLVPIATALILTNGLDAGTVLVGAGALYIAAGLYLRVPVPVQPIKAAAAIAIARDLPPATIAAAGVVLGLILLGLSATGAARWLARVFTTPIVRGLQLGVGLLLIASALRLPQRPVPTTTWTVAAVCLVLLVVAARRRNWPMALAIVAGGIAWSLATSPHAIALRPELWRPSILGDAFRPAVLWSAFTVLVIPQIPLTFGNAVVALTDLEHRFFGARARRVTPARVGLSCGLANVVAGSLGGMPMCHGSGGLSAHYRAGARSYRMNLLIGVPLLILGLGFGATAFSLLALIPVAVLVGLLAFTGVMHALLVLDLRRYELGVAVAMGVVGLWTSNLAIALAVGVGLVWLPSLLGRSRGHVDASRRPVQ
ncbi:MAG: putative sulfate/molybdate transporter [Actinomycetota bacterium]